ncbi:ATP-synt_A domain-containing protein [Cephalotus follicularis]|uniref:F-ATPase protein 6 n=1 Tax=Cephalotus follicularis TaxID=3775 RepID=A0A1Q3B296_CEPFO|nr:ATP-synt_A domain-containing protein [Cephalotus follicularis]
MEADHSAPNQGEPISEGHPVSHVILGTPAEAIYLSGVVHIPGEIEDPLILVKLSKLNGLLLFLQENIYYNMNPAYTKLLQNELNSTPHNELSEKLQSMIERENMRIGQVHYDQYQQATRPSPSTAPGPSPNSPLEQFAILPLIPKKIGNLYFSFTNPSLFMLLTLSLVLLLVHFVTKRGGGNSVPNAWQSLVELIYDCELFL